MNEQHIDLGGLTMEKLFDQAGMSLSTVKMTSPVKKINIEMDDKLFVLGFNLFCEGYDTAKYDLDDLNPNTILNIDRFHLIECMYMIVGALYAGSLLIKHKKEEDFTIDNLCRKFMTYFNDGICEYQHLVLNANYIVFNVFDFRYNNEEKINLIRDRLVIICKNIWFLPYSEIEEMKEKISKEV